MVTKYDYPKMQVDAALSVLLELLELIGEYREHIVVVGGSVPYLLFRENQVAHIGTTDVDVVLDIAEILKAAKYNIKDRLLEKGYFQDKENDFKFFRNISGQKIAVDFLSSDESGIKTAGIEKSLGISPSQNPIFGLALKKPRTISLKLPDGKTTSFQVANIPVFIVLKGLVLHERLNNKDSYDIYYCVDNFPGSLDALTREFKPFMANNFVKKGLMMVRKIFSSPDSRGPNSLADFLNIEDKEERELVQRDAYQKVSSLLDNLGIKKK